MLERSSPSIQAITAKCHLMRFLKSLHVNTSAGFGGGGGATAPMTVNICEFTHSFPYSDGVFCTARGGLKQISDLMEGIRNSLC
jgi:hypothetical protein